MPTADGKRKRVDPKKRLGKGLNSLLMTESSDFSETFISDKSISRKSRTPSSVVSKKTSYNNNLNTANRVWSLAIEKIIPNQTQPRKDFLKESLEELASSIKAQGVLQPITVREQGEKFEIVAGERRWRASQMAGLKEIPAIIKKVNHQRSMELALIENLQREDLNPLEEALGYQTLMDQYHLTQKELARKIGKSRSSIANTLRILVLSQDIREMLKDGRLTMGHGKVLLGIGDVKEQNELARKAFGNKLSVRDLELEIQKIKRKARKTTTGPETSGEFMARELAGSLQKMLGTKVSIPYKDGKGKIVIAFYSDDELSNFCERIKNP